jgi:hypothetical protein
MNARTSLLDRFADLVVETDSPPRFAERTLEVVMAFVNGRSGGAFATGDGRLTLLASRGIDQHVLDAVETLWRRARGQLKDGTPVYVPDCAADPDLAAAASAGPASLAMFPVFDGDTLVALLYVDSLDPRFCEPGDVERLSRFSRILARAVGPQAAEDARGKGWEAYLERTPVSDIQRQKLLLLLKRNAWNIARVARLMGVTRRTIYLRLQRYNIPRERIYKTRLRPAAAS